MGGGEDGPRERYDALKGDLGALVGNGSTVLASAPGRRTHYVVFESNPATEGDQTEGNSPNTVLFAERSMSSETEGLVAETYVITGALRKVGRLPWPRKVGCETANDLRLGDSAILRNPDTGKTRITKPLTDPWGRRVAGRAALYRYITSL